MAYDLGQTTPAQPEDLKPVSLGDVWNATWDDTRKVSNQSAAFDLFHGAFDEVNDQIARATGKSLSNPMSSLNTSFGDVIRGLYVRGKDIETLSGVENWKKEIEALRQSHPDALAWDDMLALPAKRAFSVMKATREDSASVNERRGLADAQQMPGYSLPVVGPFVGTGAAFVRNMATDPFGQLTQLASGFAASMTSPLDATANLISFGAGGKAVSIVKNAAINASINAVAQVPLSALKQADYKAAGLPYGWKVWAEEVGGAAIAGGLIDAGARIPARAFRTLRGTAEGQGGLFRDAIKAPDLPAPPPVREPIAPETFQKAEAGDLEALREIATKSGAIEDPVVKGALDFAEMGGKVDADTVARLRELGIDSGEGLATLAAVLRNPDAYIRTPEPVRPAERPLMAQEAMQLATERGRDIETVLRAVEPRLARMVSDGLDAGVPAIVEAVRKALATPAAKIEHASQRLAEAVQKAAETVGGMERLASQVAIHASANPIQAAAAMRAHPDLVDSSVRLDTDFMRTARALQALDADAWGRVTAGEAPAALAAEVANLSPPGQHATVLDDLMKANPQSREQARAIIPELIRRDTDRVSRATQGIDDPAGPEAQAQVKHLEEVHKEAIDEAMAPIKERHKLESKAEELKGEIAKLEGAVASSIDANRIAMVQRQIAEIEANPERRPQWFARTPEEAEVEIRSSFVRNDPDDVLTPDIVEDAVATAKADADGIQNAAWRMLRNEQLRMRKEFVATSLAKLEEPQKPKDGGEKMFAMSDQEIDRMPRQRQRYTLVGGPGDPPEIGRARAALKFMASQIGIASEHAMQAVVGANFYRRRPELGTPRDAIKQVNEGRIEAKDELVTMRREAEGQSFYYDIQDQDGASIGSAHGWVVGRKMYFDWLGSQTWGDNNQANKLGIRIIKDLREQVRNDFPNVTEFVGYRVSGARNKADAANRYQSVTMYALPDDSLKKLTKAREDLADAETGIEAIKARGTPELFALVMEARAIRRERDLMRAIDDALRLADQMLPEGTRVDVRDSVESEGYRLDAMSDTATGDIALARYALNPAARLGHEGVHTLVTRGLVSPAEIDVLAKAAREAGIDFKESQYREAYKDRPNLDRLIQEEAAAHYVEAVIAGKIEKPDTALARIVEAIKAALERVKNALSGAGYKTADDLATAILNGEAARRAPVQRWMRENDITALAVKPGMMAALGDNPSIEAKIENIQSIQDKIERLPEQTRRPLIDGYDVVVRPSIGNATYYVVPSGRKLNDRIGTFIVKPSQRMDTTGVEVTNAQMAPKSRRQGIGTALYDLVDQDWKDFGGLSPSPRDQLTPLAQSFWGDRLGHTMFAMADLDMSPEARKARAEKMGFDTSRVLYHGTTRAFEQFTPRPFQGSERPVVWLTPSQTIADIYNTSRSADPGSPAFPQDGGLTVPVFIRLGRVLRIDARGSAARSVGEAAFSEELFSQLRTEAERAGVAKDVIAWIGDDDIAKNIVEDALSALHRSSRAPSAIADLNLDPYTQRVVDEFLAADARSPGFIDRMDAIDQSRRGTNDLIDDAARQGYDTIEIKNVYDNGGHQTQVVVLDPRNIRSVNAAFDPRQSDSPNLMFAFAGENAKTADKAKLAEAQQMEAAGKDRTAIWKQTGWFRGVDRKWRFEIDDSGAKLAGYAIQALKTPNIGSWFGQADELMAHPNLYAAYPDMREKTLLVERAPGRFNRSDMSGQFDPDSGRIDVMAYGPGTGRSIALHEMQHGVQAREGFADGDELNGGMDAYWRNAGEVEARAGERRRNLTPEQRQARPPWEDYDVPESEQIVRFANGTPPKGEAMFAMGDTPVTPGLDMSPEARKQRAEEMGFDTSRVWYHGTGENFGSFKPFTFFTDDPSIASIYDSDGIGSPRVIPTYVKRGNYLVVTSTKGKTRDAVAAQAKRDGFDGVDFVGVPDFVDRNGSVASQNQRVIFSPRNIRSVNAAFDPANADSPNLMFAMNDNPPPLHADMEGIDHLGSLADLARACRG